MFETFYLLATLTTMATGAVALFCLKNQGATPAVKLWSESTSWIAFVFGVLFSLQVFINPGSQPSGYFCLGSLQGVLVPYILLMGVLVKRFAYHYLQSDQHYPAFFLKIKLLICSLLLFVVLNHVVLLVATWILSGWVICSLIAHTQTTAALNSAKLAFNRFLTGDLLLIAGFTGLSILNKSVYLNEWLVQAVDAGRNDMSLPFLVCIALGAFSKTALIPFHKWLAHTLTAPTPVSAIMHAGFVNSGSVLLAKISPLLVQQPWSMALIFTVGLLSALFGSVVMLVQTDVKRYLTFSTIGQMGFMMMECGLGAFHLAILHLVVHGFFKVRLFLSSGTVIDTRQTIINVKQNHKKAFSESFSTGLRMAGAILLVCAVTGLLILQISSVKTHLLQLPGVLATVVALSMLFISTIIIKTKGTGFKGTVIALGFSFLLVLLYVGYDNMAQGLFPLLNQVKTTQHVTVLVHYLGVAVLLMLGILVWLTSLWLLPLPLQLKNRCYVYLLNAADSFPLRSTFSNRY
jgi:NADH:ubiquinone oxidoreductase subunit 5 (subunit L)/multisubunit Na+/H+ antiporter MnhA subunit